MRKFMAGAIGLLVALTLVVGCSGDERSDGGGGGGGGGGGATGADNGRRIDTTTSVGRVVGTLGKPKRRQVLRKVSTVVDGWLDAAYVEGDYPRAGFKKSYPGFTQQAAQLARKESGTMSNAAVGKKVETVDVVKRSITVDVLAPGRSPAGATARVVLVIKLTGEIERTDRIRGRLMLTPTKKKGWKVFGFDVSRDRVKGAKKK